MRAPPARCGGPGARGRSTSSTETDVAGFQPGGTVAVEVRCDVALGDLSPLPLPGSRTVSARAVEVVDQYRGLDE